MNFSSSTEAIIAFGRGISDGIDGLINRIGKLFVGKHEPMITMREFERGQALLGKFRRQRPRTRSFHSIE